MSEPPLDPDRPTGAADAAAAAESAAPGARPGDSTDRASGPRARAVRVVEGISLANKSQVLFGVAAAVILAATLAVPWVRGTLLVREYQLEEARRIADAWLADRIEIGADHLRTALPEVSADGPPLMLSFVLAPQPAPGTPPATEDADSPTGFLAEALGWFAERPEETEYVGRARIEGATVDRYARALRAADLADIRDLPEGWRPAETGANDAEVLALLVVDREGEFAESRLLQNRIYILTAGALGILAAIAAFSVILKALILSPVRRLRDTAEAVQEGDLSIRSEIRTGDEFEQLAAAFNTMLDRLEGGRATLERMNRSLDLKVDQLAQANVGLDEANRLKSEFVASVSHELRTPLNSIIGFAELLQDLASNEEAPDPKRARYLGNIVSSGRRLLEMINELLDMAKIEAGRMEVNVEPTSVSDLVEGLVHIMSPQAQEAELELVTSVAENVPVVETDAGKLQQILYNFLSNAIKFTPAGGRVTISAERVTRQGRKVPTVRLSIADTGPGIPEDMQDAIFEKFRQLDGSHTREHAGTGLGLAICKNLAEMLGGEVSFTSRAGEGATFAVELPTSYQPEEPQSLLG